MEKKTDTDREEQRNPFFHFNFPVAENGKICVEKFKSSSPGFYQAILRM